MKGVSRGDRQPKSITYSMSDTSSDDILDGLVEDVEGDLNESDGDEEVDVDEDILEALEGGLAEQASDGDDVCLTLLFRPFAG